MKSVWVRWPHSAQMQALTIPETWSITDTDGNVYGPWDLGVGGDWVALSPYDDDMHCGRCGYRVAQDGPFGIQRSNKAVTEQAKRHRETCAPRTEDEIAAAEQEWLDAIAELREFRKKP